MASVKTIDAWRLARAARDVGVASAELVVEQFESGYCYLRLVVPAMREAVLRVVGAWPSLSVLMALPLGLFCPESQLSQERCALIGDGELHVGRGGIALKHVVAHAAVGHEYESDVFGSMWTPRYSGLMMDVTEVRSLLVGGSGVGSAVCAAGNGVAQSDSSVVEFAAGYCYAGIAHLDSATMLMSYLGTNPDLRALLAVPLRLIDVAKLSVGASAIGSDHIHLVVGGEYSFHALAYTAICNSAGYLPVGSLGRYIRDNPVPVLDVDVRYHWTVGSLSSDATAMIAELVRLTGLRPSDFNGLDVEIVCKTAALLDAVGKARLRMLEAVGDNALSMVVVQRCAVQRLVVQQYQEARSVLTNNGYLGELFVGNGLDRFVQFAAGVAHNGKVGGGCFESIIGVVYNAGSVAAVEAMCSAIGYYQGYPRWAEG